MITTADDIKREHEAAMASLSHVQKHAIDRLAKARRMSTFNHRRVGENLEVLFEADAIARHAHLASAA
jgi:hypothetical protein